MSQKLFKLPKIHAALSFIMPVALMIFCFLPLPLTLHSASAQFWHRQQNGATQNIQEAPRRSFWDKLFGRNKPPAAGKLPPRDFTPQHKAPLAIAKNPDARRVLVIGDFTAAALAEALVKTYKDKPDISIRSATRNDSGLDQNSPYNWFTNLQPILAREKPNLLIIMLGANDKLPIEKQVTEEQTEKILKPYQMHIQPFMQNLQTSQAAWIWIGLPPFKDEKLNANAQALNHIYKQVAEQSGGHFASTWEGFVDEKNSFAFSGYDINGKTVRLRTNNGVNFTLAGRYKLAFYAQQAIDLLWGENTEGEMTNSTKAGKVFNNRVAPVNPLDIGEAGLAGSDVFKANPQMADYAAKTLFAPFDKDNNKNKGETPNLTVSPPPDRADNFRHISPTQH